MKGNDELKNNLEVGKKLIFFSTIIIVLIVNVFDLIKNVENDVLTIHNIISISVIIIIFLLLIFKFITMRIGYTILSLMIIIISLLGINNLISNNSDAFMYILRDTIFMGLLFTLSAILVHKNIAFVYSSIYSVAIIYFAYISGQEQVVQQVWLAAFVLFAYSLVISFIISMLNQSIIKLEENNKEINLQLEEINTQNEEMKAFQEEIILQRNQIQLKNELLIKTNQKLDKTNTQLELLNKTKDKLFSVIAHDLKNPFYVVKGFSDLLSINYLTAPQEKIAKYIHAIGLSISKLDTLLENLLYWSRAQLNSIKVSIQNVALNELIILNINLVSEQLENKKIEICNNVDSNLIVKADKDMLLIIIRNLISNAIKFTPEYGKITINQAITGDDVVLSICDSGIGISVDRIPTIFQIVGKKSTQGTNGETGSGLGLTLCKDFIELMGGKIWVISEVKKGSNFFISMKLSELVKDVKSPN